MPPFEESGLRVTLPDEGSFRFAACPTYPDIGRRRVSEMDFGWWDEARKLISLLEIKDYSTREPVKDLLLDLVAKGRGCLMMLHAVWRDKSALGRALGAELPERCRKPQQLRLLFVLKVGAAGLLRESLPVIRGNLENHIQVYAELLDMGQIKVVLMDHEKAISMGLPIEVIAPPPQ